VHEVAVYRQRIPKFWQIIPKSPHWLDWLPSSVGFTDKAGDEVTNWSMIEGTGGAGSGWAEAKALVSTTATMPIPPANSLSAHLWRVIVVSNP